MVVGIHTQSFSLQPISGPRFFEKAKWGKNSPQNGLVSSPLIPMVGMLFPAISKNVKISFPPLKNDAFSQFPVAFGHF